MTRGVVLGLLAVPVAWAASIASWSELQAVVGAATTVGDVVASYLEVEDDRHGGPDGPARKRGSVFHSGATAAADQRLGENLKVRHRELCDDCQPLKFLYDEYDPTCWYFEVLECLRRLILTCLLPLPESWVAPSSISHAVFACVVATCFAFLYANLRPFLEDSVDNFANLMQLFLLANVFAVLVMEADGKFETRDERTGITHSAYGLFLIFLNTVGAFASLVYSMSTNAKLATAALHAREKARHAATRGLERIRGPSKADAGHPPPDEESKTLTASPVPTLFSFDEPETFSACDYASAPVCARGCSTPPEIAVFLSDDAAAAPAGVDTLLFAPDGAGDAPPAPEDGSPEVAALFLRV